MKLFMEYLTKKLTIYDLIEVTSDFSVPKFNESREVTDDSNEFYDIVI